MNFLRRAANETVRELGLSFPAVAKVVVGLGFSTTVAVIVPVPETESVPVFIPWLLKSVAWLLSIVVVFIVFCALNVRKVASRDQTARANLELAADSAVLVDDRIKSFLSNNLMDPHYGIANCYVFGSVVGTYPTRDVDVVIQFDSSKPSQVRIYRDRLRGIERIFEEHYDRMLHVQTFLSTENEDLRRFLVRAGEYECVMDRRSHDRKGLTTRAH